ncbi:MAG: hypothetical protein RLZZ396_293 [Planctomycetota bacterium]
MPMKKLLSRFALSVSMVGVLSLGALAQGPGGPGGGRGQGGPGGGGRMGMGMMGGGMMGGGVTGLLRMKEVREELKLDEDQVAELEELGKAAMEAMRNMAPQRGGPGGAGGQNAGGGQPGGFNPQDMQAIMEKMQKAAEENEAKVEEILDPKQLDRLVGLMIQRGNLQSLSSKLVATRLGITDDQKAKMAEVNKANGEKMRELFQGGFSQDAREKMTKMREEAEGKIKEILTAKQKEDMESLKGPEFKFPEPQWGGQGGPGGPGGGRGNRRPGGNDN